MIQMAVEWSEALQRKGMGHAPTPSAITTSLWQGNKQAARALSSKTNPPFQLGSMADPSMFTLSHSSSRNGSEFVKSPVI